MATFGAGTLSIGTLNEPQFTSYALIPKNTKGSKIPATPRRASTSGRTATPVRTGARRPSEAGTTCTRSVGAGNLGASQLPAAVLANMECAGQKLIFSSSVFVHETEDFDSTFPDPVFVSSHVTRQDMKAAANNGQAHIQWCLGLKLASDWTASGGSFVAQDTNGAAPGGTLFVGIAPPCPNANPQNSAPCIVSQNGRRERRQLSRSAGCRAETRLAAPDLPLTTCGNVRPAPKGPGVHSSGADLPQLR